MGFDEGEAPPAFLPGRFSVEAGGDAAGQVQPGLATVEDVACGDGLEGAADAIEVDEAGRADLAELVAVPEAGRLEGFKPLREFQTHVVLDGVADRGDLDRREVRAGKDLFHAG